MKKTYQKPNIIVVELKTAKMLAMSYTGTTSKTSGNRARGYDEDFEDEDSWW